MGQYNLKLVASHKSAETWRLPTDLHASVVGLEHAHVALLDACEANDHANAASATLMSAFQIVVTPSVSVTI
ncbi:hypothetical protein [Bradyrhizobium sp. BWA-3-5]|uniref:hypothetical protein n=1 Tax=Bradyrhizobium sp. BWA-3-5 TaxID=3080013 RepID=UPI00293F01D3|nr:hypothetical protein [Bradyrhizobium sp. BWA-3-5]WOH67854.1 hypothetical protein RX331_09055 [Bradyrhizobium sp. BWA-3-5]